MNATKPNNNPIRPIVACALFLYGAWYFQDWYAYGYQTASLVLLFISLLEGISAVWRIVSFVIPQLWRRRKAKAVTHRAGSAGWAAWKDIKAAQLHRKDGFLAGVWGRKHPLFVDIESSGLVLSPAGGGKTVSFVIPALCHNATNMIIPDLKGILAVQMADYRRRYFGHDCVILNPAGLYEDKLGRSARYNPLQILIDSWRNTEHHRYLVADSQAIAMQLYPDPAEQGENQFWRNGSRKLLNFAFLYLVTEYNQASLSQALNLLSQRDELQCALEDAAHSTVLAGDLSRLAHDILSKINDGDERQIESFREGAVQALADFAPSGDLAANTELCEFRFYELREQGMDVYLLSDPTRQNSYKAWLGLVSWCALTELIRHPKGQKICMLCDEVTNFRINNLPAMLTLVREYKICLWLIVQELKEFGKTYGKDSINTLLSQTEAKIIMGCSDYETCELVSKMLGEVSMISTNYNLGRSFFEPMSQSLQEHGRKLLTPDEVRRFGSTILFYRNHRPVALSQLGYHEVKPWSHRVGINPLFGKAYRGKTRIRLRGFGSFPRS